MKILKNIIGIVIGFVVFVVVYGICTLVIQFAGNIPILGSILYYPSDASWALIAIPAPAAVFAGSAVASAISKTAKPISVILVIYWALNIICLFLADCFTWAELIKSVFAMIAAFACFGIESDS